ncbi:hypothetical protein CEUSTIGMA_g11083.t1 [Chlamydomonas eustigma]|uniref:Uncharacterized protein n=1 Tax=Chlamydomonas eustigma TaxID=1157962 RepID=A0A250XKQ6_9CHLO|nr:hypothetical protein CEUSTIGMA_g11083.t1 [Chlamydomonas eustigma]|eukprot:GAX83658.1 hypothetical protein CEUSTIGMA_g11083.t1 [Chlamydomonas eustigma]
MVIEMLRSPSWITAVCVIVFFPKYNMLCAAAYEVITVYHGNPSAGPIIPYYMAVDVFNQRIFVTDHALPAIYVFRGFSDDGSLGKAELFAGNPEIPGWQDGPRLQPSTSASGPAAVLNGRRVPSSQSALFSRPEGICHDPSGNLFVLDHGEYTDPLNNITHLYCLLRRIDAVTGLVTTVAGDRTSSRSKDGSGSNATFSTGTLDLKCDSSGTLWIADRSSGGAVRKVMCVGEDCGGTPPPSEPPSHHAAGLFSYALWAFAILGMATTILVGAQAVDKASGQYMRYTISQLYSKWAGPGPQPHAFNITTIEVLEADGQTTILDTSTALLGDEVVQAAAVEPSITMAVNSSLTSERCYDQGTDACADLLGLPGTKTHHQKTNDDTKPLIEL